MLIKNVVYKHPSTHETFPVAQLFAYGLILQAFFSK